MLSVRLQMMQWRFLFPGGDTKDTETAFFMRNISLVRRHGFSKVSRSVEISYQARTSAAEIRLALSFALGYHGPYGFGVKPESSHLQIPILILPSTGTRIANLDRHCPAAHFLPDRPHPPDHSQHTDLNTLAWSRALGPDPTGAVFFVQNLCRYRNYH